MNNPYLKNFTIAIEENMVYTTGFLIRFATGFLFSYASVAIWQAIMLASRSQVDESTIADTIKYMVLVSSAMRLYYSVPQSEITRRLRTGEIGRDLLYPVSLPLSLFAQSMGNMAVVFLTQSLPGFIILTFLFKTSWDFSFIQLIGLILGFMLGYILTYLLTLQVDMICFWWYETFYFHYIKDAMVNFLSGAVVPLWFYPQWLFQLIHWLPFKNVAYTPAAFALGRISLEEYLLQTGILLVWLAVLIFVTLLIWRRGTKKVVVQGG